MDLLIRDGTYLNNKQEENFVTSLIDDLETFIKSQKEDKLESKQVFFLPPLPPRLRFLTHQTVQSVFYNQLSTKSVGEGDERRTAIFVTEKEKEEASKKKGQARLSSVANMKEDVKDTKKARKAEIAVYRPPHRRDAGAASTPKAEPAAEQPKPKEEKIESPKATPKSRARRPDIAVYVPRGRRSMEGPADSQLKEEPDTPTPEAKPSVESTPTKMKRRVGVCNSPLKSPSAKEPPVEVQSEPTQESVQSCVFYNKQVENVSNLPQATVMKTDECVETGDQVSELDAKKSESPTKSPRKYFDKPRISRTRKTSFVPVEEQTNEPVFEKPKPTRKPSINYHGSEIDEPSEVWRVEVSELYNGCADLTERLESSGYNSADSDKKDEIRPVIASVEEVDPEKLKFANQLFDSESRDFDSASPKGDNDSWDMIFNDDGEPVKPEVLEELSLAVGKTVQVSKPKIDYLSFVPTVDESQFDEELSHVVEFYDFSPTLKTEDLLIIFGGIRQSGGQSHFDIKWVDDTHALGVFSSPAAALEALKLIHPLAKARSLAQASRESKLKARKVSEFLQPYKPRPATTVSAARRLVTGALGLKANVTPEQRRAEAQKLRDAKANKKMAAKQREDAWEGNFEA